MKDIHLLRVNETESAAVEVDKQEQTKKTWTVSCEEEAEREIRDDIPWVVRMVREREVEECSA